jgi:hypothetical protein
LSRAHPIPVRQSLGPGRLQATSCAQLCSVLLDNDWTDTILGDAFAQGMHALEAALNAHFPHNIYGDLDHLATSLLTEARQHANPVDHLQQSLAIIEELLKLYGRHSPIHFRYAHDFLYGFDWARWVRKSPQQRRQTGPFSRPFMEYLRQRGIELLSLIEIDDPTYPRLPHNRDRNPFSFSRSPDDETRLHVSLAADGLIPVEAWRADSPTRCDRDYSALRQQRARHLQSDHA